MMSEGRPARLALPDWLALAVLAAALVLRIASANYGLWLDETASTVFARQPIALLWSGWMVRETNPPLFYTLLGLWQALFGDGDRAVRMLPVVIAAFDIVFGWAIARRLGGAWAGLIAVALFASSPMHVDFSQEVRGYILAHAAVLAAVLAMIGYIDRPRLPPLVGYVFAATVALYSHTTLVVFVLLANAAMLWLLRRNRRALIHWIGANAVVVLLWAWWGWITLRQVHAPHPNFGWIGRPSPLAGWVMTSSVYLPNYLVPLQPLLLVVLMLVLLGAIGWLVMRDRRPGIVLLAAMALGAPVVLWLVSQAVPVFVPRTLFWAAGPLLVLVALALSRIRSRPLAITATLLLVGFQLLVVARWLPVREEEGWREALTAIGARSPHATLLVEGDAVALAAARYHHAAPGVRIVVLNPHPAAADAWADGLAAGPHVDAAGARALLRQGQPVFAYRRGDSDPAATLGLAAQDWPRATGGRQPHVELLSAR